MPDYFITILLLFKLTFALLNNGKMITDIPANIEFKMDKDSNLKIEGIKVSNIQNTQKPLEVTLKYLAMEPGFKFFFNPIDIICEDMSGTAELFNEENNQIDHPFSEYLAFRYLSGFRLCSVSNMLEFKQIAFVRPLFSYIFEWKKFHNELTLKDDKDFSLKLIKGKGIFETETEQKNGTVILEELKDVTFSFIKFRYQNWMLNSLEVSVQVIGPGYYKLFINRINDECNMEKTSKIYQGKNQFPQVVIHGRFNSGGFENGFVICIRIKPLPKEQSLVDTFAGGAKIVGSTVAGGAQLVRNKVAGGAHFVGDTVTGGAHFVGDKVTGGAMMVGGKVAEGKDAIGNKIGEIAKNTLDSASTIPTGLARTIRNFPSFIRRQKRASSSSSTSSVRESPRNSNMEKSVEKEEDIPYKIVAKIRPIFYDGFEKKFQKEMDI
ncbi:hypothetical protein ACQ4LE_003965 [Meloidogyne hapla]|uniref:Uncharacterized protein n=1 Tax=Meloidogyne hapla TaxID=6305 RepID=A0A1I8BSD1_MELHA